MTTHRHPSIPSNAPISFGSPFSLLVNAVTGWASNARNRHEYEQLLRKTDSELDDVGIDRQWLKHEARKGFWQS